MGNTWLSILSLMPMMVLSGLLLGCMVLMWTVTEGLFRKRLVVYVVGGMGRCVSGVILILLTSHVKVWVILL